MNNLNFSSLLLFLILFVPGFVFLKTYDLLIASEKRDFSKSLLEVIAFSAINLALLSWLIWPIFYYRLDKNNPIIFTFLVFFILCIFPALLSWVYVKIIELQWIAKKIVHPVKRPWDWIFNKKKPFWIIVTLKDGRKIGGIFSKESKASSFPEPEQIYLEIIWKLDKNGRFLYPIKGSKGVIILHDQISVLELFNQEEATQ